MVNHRYCLRVGAAAILCALLLRLESMDLLHPVVDFLTEPKTASWLIYLETGRIVRFSPSSAKQEVFSLESHTPDFAQKEQLTLLPGFTAREGREIAIRYNCTLRPDLESLITAPLVWDLYGEEPTVLILHTHATESYTPSPGEDYRESSAFRTLDEDYNMISVGAHLARLLEAAGIRVIQDTTLHDYPSYNGSYNHARKSTIAYLEEYPSIRLVLDLHRDAADTESGQLRTTANLGERQIAQLMLVMGTDEAGLSHPDWEENLSLALKLHARLEQQCPGIMRPLILRSQRFNQDMSPGALLVEVGAAGNTHDEALAAAEQLAEAIAALAHGSQ